MVASIARAAGRAGRPRHSVIHRSFGLLLWALLAGALVGLAWPGAVRAAVSLEEAPLAVHRMAAQFLEDHKGTESAPDWKGASLSNQVTPLYRPDVSGVAYYEFAVNPSGYILVSAGGHDFPIASWSDTATPPSQMLMEQAGGKASKFYKLDSLSYVAEDGGGEMVASTPDIPARIEGLAPSYLEKWMAGQSELNEFTSATVEKTEDDEAGAQAKRENTLSGPSQPDIKLGDWNSWGQLKEEYAKVFDGHLTAWRKLAGEEWAVENNISQFGTGLVRGESEKVALLYAGAKVALEGEGSKYVETQLHENQDGTSYLAMQVGGSPGGQNMADFTVNITYGNGMQESLPYFVTEGETLAQAGMRVSWSSWSESYAVNWDAQRLYAQWSCCGCVTGCGPVAWGMLFGWADHQAAAGNSYWRTRWGIYRANGGTGSDADAPRTQDSGVRNMILELRDDVNTFCAFGSGATCPWDMGGASDYLSNRTGARLSSRYNAVGYCETGLRNCARDEIQSHSTPAVIGIGWLSHYPLAYAYRSRSRRVRACFICWWDRTEYQRQFKINTGWGTSYGPQWESAETWFCGRLFPN